MGESEFFSLAAFQCDEWVDKVDKISILSTRQTINHKVLLDRELELKRCVITILYMGKTLFHKGLTIYYVRYFSRFFDIPSPLIKVFL